MIFFIKRTDDKFSNFTALHCFGFYFWHWALRRNCFLIFSLCQSTPLWPPIQFLDRRPWTIFQIFWPIVRGNRSHHSISPLCTFCERTRYRYDIVLWIRDQLNAHHTLQYLFGIRFGWWIHHTRAIDREDRFISVMYCHTFVSPAIGATLLRSALMTDDLPTFG